MTQLPYGLKTTGRGKAYEMMSCFVGLTEYARVTDDQALLSKVIEARDHIADYYREVNGCMSEREWFPQRRKHQRTFRIGKLCGFYLDSA